MHALLAAITILSQFALELWPDAGALVSKLVVPLIACGMLYAAHAAAGRQAAPRRTRSSAFRAPAGAIAAIVVSSALTFAAEWIAADRLAGVDLLRPGDTASEIDAPTVLAIYAVGILVSLPMSLVPLSRCSAARGFAASFADSAHAFVRHPVGIPRLRRDRVRADRAGPHDDGLRARHRAAADRVRDLRRVARPGRRYADGRWRKSLSAGSGVDLVDVDAVDARRGRPAARPRDRALDRRVVALHPRLDGAVAAVAHPAGDAESLAASTIAKRNPTPCTRPCTTSRRAITPAPPLRSRQSSAATVFASVISPRVERREQLVAAHRHDVEVLVLVELAADVRQPVRAPQLDQPRSCSRRPGCRSAEPRPRAAR